MLQTPVVEKPRGELFRRFLFGRHIGDVLILRHVTVEGEIFLCIDQNIFEINFYSAVQVPASMYINNTAEQ